MKHMIVAFLMCSIWIGLSPEPAAAFACNYYSDSKLQTVAPGNRNKHCRELFRQLRKRQGEIEELRNAIVGLQLDAIAEALHGTSGDKPNLTRIQIDQQPTAFSQWCCTCIPGENCSGDFTDVCDPTNDGTCQEGEIRTVCSTGPDEACSPID
jgi:hypothetical protein